MCLAVPAQIETIDDTKQSAVVSLGHIKKTISIALVEGLQPGDYVLVHVGFALSKIDEKEAEKTLALFAEAGIVEKS